MDFPKIKRILIIILFLNWLVALAKILVGILTGSLSVLADGFHSLFDGMSNILGFIGVKLAERPKDLDHPYGHRKFEALSAFGIAFLILITGYEFAKNAVGRFIHPMTPEFSFLSFIIVGGALLVDLCVYFYENSWGKKLKSNILVADSLHTKTHLLTTPSVLLGMMAVKAGFPVFDPIITLFIIFALLKLSWRIIKENSGILCDRALIDVEKIQKVIESTQGVKSFHQIRTRGDEHYAFLDMHITLDPNLPLKEAHEISHVLKEKIMKEIPQIKDVVIHTEPKV